MTEMTAKRRYNRRDDSERIAEMEARIRDLRRKIDSRERPDQDVISEVPKIQRRLRTFAQLAMKHGRADIANTTMAFMAGLDRMKDDEPESMRGGRNGGA